MKILYEAGKGSPKIPIPSSYGTQYVLLWLELDSDQYLYIGDVSTSQCYINKIVDKSLTNGDLLFHHDNIERIESDEEYEYLKDWIHNHYNYTGIHKDDSLDLLEGDKGTGIWLPKGYK